MSSLIGSDRIRDMIRDVKAKTSLYTIHDLLDAFMGYDDYTASNVRNRLVWLLEQADPDTHVELPTDADGMPIHIGDVMEWQDGSGTFDVVAVSSDTIYYIDDQCKCQWTRANNKLHHHKPTAQEIMIEYLRRFTSGDISQDDLPAVTDEYVARIREAMQDD